MRRQSFSTRYAAWSARFDRFCRVLAGTGLLLLVATQWLLLYPSWRCRLSYVYRAEGRAISQGGAAGADRLALDFYLVDSEPTADVKLLVNGRERGDFRAGELFLALEFGDTVEIDGSMAGGERRVAVGSLPEALDAAALRPEAVTAGNRVTLGRVLPRLP